MTDARPETFRRDPPLLIIRGARGPDRDNGSGSRGHRLGDASVEANVPIMVVSEPPLRDDARVQVRVVGEEPK
ncbi:hypothetical protein GCM10022402_09490 [Salinactinospora qingdaonensis]|uniref:Uncharacterized protein n=1 Tax=Salinactinospora qingdaonensis TaxID=702744 RepID=A0ABP7F3T7_9ACTN